LKALIHKIYSKLGISSNRTRNITKHIGISFFLKGGSIIANFLIVPLTINYLDNENYGIWLTLSSFIAWFSFFDIGLGNGLRNKFAEAKANGDDKIAQAYVSSAYFTIGTISLIIVFLFFIINPFVNWAAVFNTNDTINHELKILMPIIFAFFGLQLIIKLITTIYAADQHHSIQGKIQFITQAISLLLIWLLTKTTGSSLLIFGIVFSALPVLILIFLNFFAFRKRYKTFKPDIRLWKKEYLKDIMGLGFNFFIIQIAALVLFSTDNFIITQLFSPAEVVPYNTAYKYFSILTMVYSIIVTPYWSAFTEAFTRKDFDWIKISVRNIQRIWLIIPLVAICMVLLSDLFYSFWIGDQVIVPISLSISMAFYVTILTFNMIYSHFINGVGKIKLNLIFSIISMVINIPLSLFFVKILNFGSAGVILATCVCLLYALPFLPIQYYKLVNCKAKGIWDK